jgi:hypothetical protein
MRSCRGCGCVREGCAECWEGCQLELSSRFATGFIRPFGLNHNICVQFECLLFQFAVGRRARDDARAAFVCEIRVSPLQ